MDLKSPESVTAEKIGKHKTNPTIQEKTENTKKSEYTEKKKEKSWLYAEKIGNEGMIKFRKKI